MLHAEERLTLDRPFQNWLQEAASPAVVEILPLDVEVVIALHQMPEGLHGDPADRLIVATARAHGLVLATHDQALRNSGVIRIWRGTRT